MRFSDPVSHLRSHFSQEYLGQLRNTALAAAGFSAGLIVLLAQTKGQATYSEVSLWAAIASLVIWLFAWQYVLPYIVHGERTYNHFNFNLAALLTLSGLTALLTAVVAIVWRLSVCAGIVLTALSGILAIAVLFHNWAVDRHCNGSDA
ncbi:hypothetical protein ACFOED_10150 [Vulcaniibacterium thermophilum]|nr:hypothetical protein [Vulcaniibacterium thermophilum]